MIGSQATKTVESCGVWKAPYNNTWEIETYPSVLKVLNTIEEKILRYETGLQFLNCFKSKKSNRIYQGENPDIQDAFRCALAADLFQNERSSLHGPKEFFPASEGWICFPKDVNEQKYYECLKKIQRNLN